MIIMHDRDTHKYRAFTFQDMNSPRHDILGIINYNEGDDAIEELAQMCVSDPISNDITKDNRRDVFNRVNLDLIGDFIPNRRNVKFQNGDKVHESAVRFPAGTSFS